MIKTYIQFFWCALLAELLLAGSTTAQEVKVSNPGSTSVSRPALTVHVTGTVKDASTGKPLSGIQVSYGRISADVTDDKGAFALSVPSGDVDIILSGEGFEKKQVSLKGRTDLAISLLPATGSSFQRDAHLQYESRSLRSTTASIAQVNVDANWNRPFETVDELLQGRVAGLQSIRRSGSTLTGANLLLRGYGSLHTSNMPLIVVDGMIYDNQDYGQSIIGNQYTNPLSLIHAQDVDHISVIKDGTAEYGTRGANGVIIITTARAKKQATAIDFSAYTSYNERPEGLHLMDASSYRTYLNEILLGRGHSPASIAAMPFMNDDNRQTADYYRYHNNTNWQDQVMRNSMSKNYFLKVTGGDNIATYALSIGLSNLEGIMKSNSLTKYNTRFNAAFNFSKRLSGLANLGFTVSEQQNRSQGIDPKIAPLFVALTKSPFMIANEVNEKGILSPNLEDSDILGISNPMALVRNAQGQARQYRFTGSYTFKYNIARKLTASAMIGILFDKNRETIFIPRKGVTNDTLQNAIADSRLGSQVRRLFSTYFDTRLEYATQFGYHHHFSTKMGLRYQQNRAEQDFTLGFNSATDDLISVQNGVSALKRNGGGIGEWNWMNTYLNAEYSFKDRLFLYAGGSLDGSSRFGAQAAHGVMMHGEAYAFNPSAGMAWIVSSGNDWGDKYLDLLRFRLTLSRTGNDDIGNYTHRQTYGSTNLLGMQGLVRNGIANPAIQWERNTRLNAGIDLSVWNDRWTTSVDFYRQRTSDMLVMDPMLSSTGFESVWRNAGVMLNTGVEIASNVRLLNRRKLKFDIGLTYAANRNTLVSLPLGSMVQQVNGVTLMSMAGQPAAAFFGYRTQGIYSTTEAAAAAGLRTKLPDGTLVPFQAGDVRFVDLNRDGLIDERDRQVLGSALPRYHGSFSGKLTIGRFSADALFTFVQGLEIFNQLRYQLEQASGVANQLNSVAGRWRAEGQQASMPKASAGDPRGNNRFSDRWMEDGSYLRLRALVLAYNVEFGEKFFKNATLYATGNNLLMFTRYTGFDPEFSTGNSIFHQGVDGGLDPQFRSVTLGMRLGL